MERGQTPRRQGSHPPSLPSRSVQGPLCKDDSALGATRGPPGRLGSGAVGVNLPLERQRGDAWAPGTASSQKPAGAGSGWPPPGRQEAVRLRGSPAAFMTDVWRLSGQASRQQVQGRANEAGH